MTEAESFRFFVSEYQATKNIETAFHSAVRRALAHAGDDGMGRDYELSAGVADIRKKRDEDLQRETPEHPNTLILRGISKLTGYPVEALVRPSNPQKRDHLLLCRAKWMAIWAFRRRNMTMKDIASVVGVSRDTARTAIDKLARKDSEEVDRMLVGLFGTIEPARS